MRERPLDLLPLIVLPPLRRLCLSDRGVRDLDRLGVREREAERGDIVRRGDLPRDSLGGGERSRNTLPDRERERDCDAIVE